MATFSLKRYESDRGNIFFTKVEDLDGVDEATGAEPGGTVTEDMTVRIGRNNSEAGIRPRFVTLARGLGAAVADPEVEISGRALVNAGLAYRRAAVLTPAHFDTLERGATITIEGTEYTIVGKQSEDVN